MADLGRFALLPAPNQYLGRHGDHRVVDGRGKCEKMTLGGRDRTWCAGEIGHTLGFDEPNPRQRGLALVACARLAGLIAAER